MNEMLRRRMSATQQASEQQTGDAADEQIFQMPVPQTETQFRDVPISKLRPFFTADIGFHPYPHSKLEAFAEELKENGLYERDWEYGAGIRSLFNGSHISGVV